MGLYVRVGGSPAKGGIMAKRRAKAKSTTKAPRLDKWEIEGAADTLMRAGEIDATPRLKAAANKILVKRQKAIAKVIKRKPPKT